VKHRRWTASLGFAAALGGVGGCAALLGLADPVVPDDAASEGDSGSDDGHVRDDGPSDVARADVAPDEDVAHGEGGGGWDGCSGPGSEGGVAPTAPSCLEGGPGRTTCGPSGTGSCCTSPAIPCGTFDRSYDVVTYTDPGHPAAVSAFRLDEYEVTVGRFRPFAGAVMGGWMPPAGSGKHAHLRGGLGLAATPNDAGVAFETGWDPSWSSSLQAEASSYLICNPTIPGPSWTPDAGEHESYPVVCLTWFAAYAFCIWDGGFLPSEAEWNYAAAAGSAQRAYPWSSPSTSTTIDCTHANYYNGGAGCGTLSLDAVGSQSPTGDGRWGQADLAGNADEWTLDWYEPTYGDPCVDCAALAPSTYRAYRGGGVLDVASGVLVSARGPASPGDNYSMYGVRCARAP
jgi:formylglycine-generating enzyme